MRAGFLSRPSPRWTSSDRPAAGEETVDPEQDDRAERRHQDGPDVDPRDPGATEDPHDEAAHEGTGDAYERRQDQTAGITPRHYQLGQQTGDQTYHDERQNTHCFSLPRHRLCGLLVPKIRSEEVIVSR